MAEPGSEEMGGGATEVLGACPKVYQVNFCQFRGLFKGFSEKGGGGHMLRPPPGSANDNLKTKDAVS